jgi:hypothetical protein
MARCRARTEDGTGPLCKNRVSEPGMRCHHHTGLPEAPPRLPKPSTGRARRTSTASHSFAPPPPRCKPTQSRAEREERRRQERVRRAAEYCADIVASDWEDVVAERAAGYVCEETWNQLLRSRRRRTCRALAEAANDLLRGRQKIHGFVGFLAGRGIRFLGGSDAVQAFAQELVAAIPLPTDAKFVAAARGLQVTGVLLCVMNDRDLTRCECFIDLALNETKAQVKKILITAMGDWTRLGAFPPKGSSAWS